MSRSREKRVGRRRQQRDISKDDGSIYTGAELERGTPRNNMRPWVNDASPCQPHEEPSEISVRV